MSTEVSGFVPPDETWLKMKAVWDACDAAGIDAPDEVASFFNDERPDPAGQTIDIPSREWSDDRGAGLEIVLADLPPQVRMIRFRNSW
jgi:hypothetical protein